MGSDLAPSGRVRGRGGRPMSTTRPGGGVGIDTTLSVVMVDCGPGCRVGDGQRLLNVRSQALRSVTTAIWSPLDAPVIAPLPVFFAPAVAAAVPDAVAWPESFQEKVQAVV